MASSTFPSRPNWRRSCIGFASTTRKRPGSISGSAILRYRYAPDFDHSIVLDTDGSVIEQNGGRFLLGEVWMNKNGGVWGLTSARPSPPSAGAELQDAAAGAPGQVLVPSRSDGKGVLLLTASTPGRALRASTAVWPLYVVLAAVPAPQPRRSRQGRASCRTRHRLRPRRRRPSTSHRCR